MKNENEKINDKQKRSSLHRCILAAICVVLLIICALFAASLRWEPKPDLESERIIREHSRISTQ